MIDFNKKKTCFIVDTSCDIRENEIDDIYVVPLNVIVTQDNKSTSYRDEVEINMSKLKECFKKKCDIKTSQANMIDMINVVESLSEKYDRILAFPIHDKLSGNFNSWNSLSSEYDKLSVFRLNDISTGIRWTINALKEKMKSEYLTDDKINAYIEKHIHDHIGWLLVKDMAQLAKGGRVSNFKAAAGKLFGIQPIIRFDDKGLEFAHKVKNDLQYFQFVKKEINELGSGKKVKQAMIFTACSDNVKLKAFTDLFEKEFPNVKYKITPLPVVIVAHVGPDFFAVYVDLK